ncbi:uncharacterized protein LOC130047614 isoform X3 [Ostrea edulis]|uniref:uncharacterized protein LOC130047614 isoform X3 n=1 Tax=Ostrea edulis TaxID=37623 RepID=UPI0024AE9C3A|nr:uncharacterized protein LOC130047614 isoform X3 [Ostrea edulis]
MWKKEAITAEIQNSDKKFQSCLCITPSFCRNIQLCILRQTDTAQFYAWKDQMMSAGVGSEYKGMHVPLHVCCSHGSWGLSIANLPQCVHIGTETRVCVLQRTFQPARKTQHSNKKRRFPQVLRMCSQNHSPTESTVGPKSMASGDEFNSSIWILQSTLCPENLSTQGQKKTGDARILEEAAKASSSALPLILNIMSGLSHDDIHKEVEKIQTVEMDIRILEGIALPTILARQFLNAAGRSDLMETVLNYIKDVLIPYYKEIINPSIRDVADIPTSKMKTLLNICTSQQGNGVTTIVNSTFAVKSDLIKDPSLRKEIQALGGKMNHSVRLNGKPKKCITIPKTSMTEEQWKSVASAMLKAVPPPTTTDRAAVPPPTRTDQAAVPPPTTTDRAAVPPSTRTDRAAVPPPTTTDRTAVPPPTRTDRAAVPPPTTTDRAAVPPPTRTDRAAVPPPTRTDRAAVPPPTRTDWAAVPPPTRTDRAAVPPSTRTDQAALPPQATHRTVPQLPFPIQKLQKKTITTCFKCRKVGSKFLHWGACDGCRKWYHRKCTTLSCKDYLKLTEDSVWNCDICIV